MLGGLSSGRPGWCWRRRGEGPWRAVGRCELGHAAWGAARSSPQGPRSVVPHSWDRGSPTACPPPEEGIKNNLERENRSPLSREAHRHLQGHALCPRALRGAEATCHFPVGSEVQLAEVEGRMVVSEGWGRETKRTQSPSGGAGLRGPLCRASAAGDEAFWAKGIGGDSRDRVPTGCRRHLDASPAQTDP